MSNKTGNPFLDQNFAEAFDFTKYAEQFQVPGVDNKALMDTYRKNIEAVSQANRVAFEGAQAVAQRQGEIMRQAMEEAVQAMQQGGNSSSPDQQLAKQSEIAKKAFESGLKNARELAEMSAKSNQEAMELINKRMAESFDELREAVQSVVKQSQSMASSMGQSAAGGKK